MRPAMTQRQERAAHGFDALHKSSRSLTHQAGLSQRCSLVASSRGLTQHARLSLRGTLSGAPVGAGAALPGMLSLLLAVMLWPASGLAGETAPHVDDQLHDHAEAMPSCPQKIEYCLGVRLFVAPMDGKPVVDPVWLSAQFERANLLLEPLGVCLQVHSLEMLPKSFYHLKSRSDRDRLGGKRWKRGWIHIFVAGKVNNVDEPGEIYGVHWRWRKNSSRRWVILSAASWSMTLAHELGHFFGLPHNDIIGSIMNKAGNDPTPIWDRRFTSDEITTMKKTLESKLKSKELLRQPVQVPDP